MLCENSIHKIAFDTVPSNIKQTTSYSADQEMIIQEHLALGFRFTTLLEPDRIRDLLCPIGPQLDAPLRQSKPF